MYNDKGLAMKTLIGEIDKLKEDIAKIESKGQSGNTLNSVNKTIMELMEKNENSEYGLQGKESAKLKQAIATRKTLTENGFAFYSHSDTEVLLKSYIHYGKDVVNHLNGKPLWQSLVIHVI